MLLVCLLEDIKGHMSHPQALGSECLHVPGMGRTRNTWRISVTTASSTCYLNICQVPNELVVREGTGEILNQFIFSGGF